MPLRVLSLIAVLALAAAGEARANRALAFLGAKGQKLVKAPYEAGLAKSSPLAAGALLKGTRTTKDGRSEVRPYLSKAQYEQLRDGALELMQRYPPEAHYYLGIGRSPTPVIAFLENLGPRLASSLPVSGFKVRDHQVAPTVTLDKAWMAHLGRFLPDELLERLERQGRAIVVVDRAVTGNSVSTVASLVSSYLARKGRSIRVVPVAFSKRQVSIDRIDVTYNQELLDMNHYEPWSEWPSYHVGSDPPGGPERRGEYDRFREKLLERMKRDPALAY